MAQTLFFLILIIAVLFAVMLGFTVAQTRRARSSKVRTLDWIMSALFAALILEATQRLSIQAVRAGWLPQSFEDFLLSGWQVVQSLGALALGLSVYFVFQKIRKGLGEAELVVEILTERIPAEVSVVELGLTHRELEVLEVIGRGKLSDQEIADILYISSATAGTHVRNILRKAGLHRRNDLLLLVSQDRVPS